jgi:hypothetical protein
MLGEDGVRIGYEITIGEEEAFDGFEIDRLVIDHRQVRQGLLGSLRRRLSGHARHSFPPAQASVSSAAAGSFTHR